MPYIKQNEREKFNAMLDDFEKMAYLGTITAGDLNYLFTMISNIYLDKNKKYQTINNVVGALEGAKLEFYRKAVAPYEDEKIEENGDINLQF